MNPIIAIPKIYSNIIGGITTAVNTISKINGAINKNPNITAAITECD
jgi:hypothetical protein